jgi:hypothetical protein
VDLGGVDLYCFPSCTTSTQCRDGYACFDVLASNQDICWPHCEFDSECPDTQNCNRWTGMCGQTATGWTNGHSCQTSDPTVCRSSLCYTPFPATVLQYCTSWCDLQTGNCPGDGICSDVYSGARADQGLCLDACNIPGDCYEAGWDCVTNPYGSGTVCDPD